jgi:predicted nucleic acid-binding OB-fold protein
LGINLVKAHEDGWDSLSSLFGKERFFLLDTNIGGKYGQEIFNDIALDPNSDIKDLVENPSVFAEFTKAKANDRSNYDQCFPKHLIGFKKYEQLMRQCMFDGGISNFRRFLLYQWPIQIVSEIIEKSESDISEFLVDAENLNSKLKSLEKLNPYEISNIQNATAALTKIKVEITKAGFKPLADGLKDLINQAVAVHTYTPATPIDQVIKWLKTEAKLGATKILSQIVIDGGLIDECYKYIEDQGDFSSHDLRVSPTNRDTLKLNALWYKTIPLKKVLLNRQMQNDIQKLLIPHQVIIGVIEDNFWNTLKNKTGIDELLADLTMVRHSDTGVIKIDMFDWAQSILTNQNSQKNYNQLDSLIKEAVNNLAVDCAEVIKNFLLEQINKLIDERQAILFLCT